MSGIRYSRLSFDSRPTFSLTRSVVTRYRDCIRAATTYPKVAAAITTPPRTASPARPGRSTRTASESCVDQSDQLGRRFSRTDSFCIKSIPSVSARWVVVSVSVDVSDIYYLDKFLTNTGIEQYLGKITLRRTSADIFAPYTDTGYSSLRHAREKQKSVENNKWLNTERPINILFLSLVAVGNEQPHRRCVIVHK